jgi:hypothetical protein
MPVFKAELHFGEQRSFESQSGNRSFEFHCKSRKLRPESPSLRTPLVQGTRHPLPRPVILRAKVARLQLVPR